MDELIARLRAVSETGCDLDLPHEAADAIEALVRRAEDAEQLSVARGHTIQGLRRELSAVKVERDALAAKLKELEGQEPVAWAVKNGLVLDCVKHSEKFARTEAERLQKSHDLSGPLAAYSVEPLFARPVPADPVNARLMEALQKIARYPSSRDDEMSVAMARALARDAISAAESQQAEPVRSPGVCQGTNCGATNGANHSPECIVETAEAQRWGDAPEAEEARKQIGHRAEPVRLTGDQLEDLVKWYGEEPNIYLDRREYARTIQDEVLRANGYKVEG